VVNPVKILLVDDDEEDFFLTRSIVKAISHRKYDIEWISSFPEAIIAVKQNRHDVYLIDYRLGPENGLEMIRTIRKGGQKIPLILLTGQGDVEIDEKAMEAGATDYLTKGKIKPYDLDRSIRYSIQHSKNLEEIQKLNTDLEERVQDRTSELFNAIKKLEEINKKQYQREAEVRKALEKEKELNELKSRFVTIASHEFKTPLTTILSAASLISKYNEAGNQEKISINIDRIKSSVTNLSNILNDFLSLSKLEDGVIGSNPSVFNMKALIDEIKGEMASMLKQGQNLVHHHQGAETIILDKQIMKNILINLISNAIKYSERGKIEIACEVTSSEIYLSVKDEGIGIPESDKTFLFTRFFRSRNAGNIQGTGLGLNIVKRYIELLNGNIDYESELEKGTTFKIEIPIAV
jgi:signal transduction histidine kinase